MFQKEYWERKALEGRRAPSHPVVKQYVDPKIRLFRRVIPLEANTRVLEVGCGNGFFSEPLEKICEVTGVDYSEKMIGKNPISRRLLMDAHRLAFQDMSFDMVFCHALLHHVEDINGVLQEMRRVSKKYVVVLEPNRSNPFMFLFSAWVPEERKALDFSRNYLKKKLAENGLKTSAVFTHGMTVPNKTPAVLLPLMKLLDFCQPFGMTHILVAER